MKFHTRSTQIQDVTESIKNHSQSEERAGTNQIHNQINKYYIIFYFVCK